MELIEKPPKTTLINCAKEYFRVNQNANVVAMMTKEGREFWFRRDPNTGEPVKISRQEAEAL